jgi:hypothetical protein
MPIALSPIQPSSPPPMYCAECGCEVDPAAWLCATCGKSLHEPGAMTSECPFSPATSKNFKPDFIVAEYLLPLILGVALVIVYIASEMRRHSPKGIDWILFCIMVVGGAAELIFWLGLYFDSR